MFGKLQGVSFYQVFSATFTGGTYKEKAKTLEKSTFTLEHPPGCFVAYHMQEKSF